MYRQIFLPPKVGYNLDYEMGYRGLRQELSVPDDLDFLQVVEL